MQKAHGRELHDHQLSVQVLQIKVALLMGADPPNQQSLRRQRYAMDAMSSADVPQTAEGTGENIVEQHAVRDGSRAVGSLVSRIKDIEDAIAANGTGGTPSAQQVQAR